MSEIGNDSFASKINDFLNDSEIDVRNKSINSADRSPEHLYEEDDDDELLNLKLKNTQLQREKEQYEQVSCLKNSELTA